MLSSRVLPEAEWGRLKDLPPMGPLSWPVVAEDETGEIRGYWIVMTAVHVEPIWIDPRFRGNAGMLRKLWRGVRGVLKELNCKFAVAVVMRDNPPTHAIERLGFQKVNGDLWYAPVDGTVKY
jgi:hypothetical protein